MIQFCFWFIGRTSREFFSAVI